MNESDFDPFKMQNDSTTAADTLVSQSSTTYSAESNSTSSEHKKKKKKEKKSSKKSKSSSVKSGAVSSSYSEELFGKMLANQDDGFSNNFGEFTDIQQVPKEASIDGSGSRRSTATSRASSRRTPNTSATYSRSSGVFTDGVPSEPIIIDDVSFTFPADEDLFSPKGIDEDDDDDSGLSEITGLTSAFSCINVYGDFDDEDDNENVIANESKVKIDSPHMPFPRIYNTTSARRVVKNEYMEKLIGAKSMEKRGVTKSVSFSDISVRHYERIIEENPSTIKGPSIGIGWKYEFKGTTTIDHYEVVRGPPRPSPNLVLTVEQREKILSDQGYTQKDIANAVRNILKVRNQRRQTVQNLKAEKIEEAFEGAGKRVKRILNPFSKQK
jgi:hypothetical protein